MMCGNSCVSVCVHNKASAEAANRIAALERELAAAQERVKYAEGVAQHWQGMYERERDLYDRQTQELTALRSRADQDRADAEKVRLGPFIHASIEPQSGLHELWLLCNCPDGQQIVVAGPAPWPKDWGRLHAYAKQHVEDADMGIDAARATQKESEKEKQNG